ncbi:RES domain-containing protein [Curtobacterium sp. MCSS17_015]|uniref:RES domain-containing protein n=1 Tax=Curtobacterium sp. MCSS17_015 TaxID=2175666 RepID=UPI000DA86254|nr:RES domain-containing protein [Curtobacterium sp. MCSS17_015]WIB26726.1 RES domain-containing protein [Curtobacterium sp. MCSS17_015]
MSVRAPRTCTTTGLRLLPSAGDIGYRIAKNTYAPISAPTRRDAGSHQTERSSWGRYDSVDTATLYTADSRSGAFAEVLAGFKLPLGTGSALETDAAALGLTLEEFLADVAADWEERAFMQTGTLPRSWRDDRTTLVIEHPAEGWLVDIEHPDSISALESSLRTHLLVGGYAAFTTAALRGDDRALTTAVADIVHDARLDDGSRPLGIHFGSKHGGSWCRALWLDRTDSHLTVTSSEAITLEDPDFRTVTRRFGIRAF